MNEAEIHNILNSHIATKPFFLGVFAADELHINIDRFPALLIVNTSNRQEGGLHWVCMYFTTSGQCEYFDSLGQNAKVELVIFMKKFSNSYVCLNERIQDYNTNSCGLYGIDFAIARCSGVSFLKYISQFDTIDLHVNESTIYYKWCVLRSFKANVCLR